MDFDKITEYNFQLVYKYVSIINDAVKDEFDFWNFDPESFVQSAIHFNKNSLLHIYVSSTLYCYYLRYFRKNGDLVEKEDIDEWIEHLNEYDISLTDKDYDEESEDAAWNWFKKNEELFILFFESISDEVVYILFSDKSFLVKFNRLVRKVLIDEDDTYADYLIWPDGVRNEDGTIKRCAIPKWVKNAVFHRDKGRCVFCNKDLTGLVNILNQKNFDHIIPLKDYGTNDPCNIQLTCEECNKSKGAKDRVPTYYYQRWW